MAEKHHLPENLRELRLSGMLDTLDLRIDQAEKEKLGYVNFLELLLEDEIARRKHSQLTSRISKAHFKEKNTS
ncbi:ATP-binding protein [Thermodesulfovibrionales bacterium]|nr:ATP-binding protein [Thermodesulfovibrionales bacterium]